MRKKELALDNTRGLIRFLPIAFFVGLTIIMVWPLISKLSTATIGLAGDNLYYLWLCDWINGQLLQGHGLSLVVPDLNYPDGWSLAYTEISSINVLTALVFRLFGNATFAYNLTILASYVLSGWIVYLWVKDITRSMYAGLIAGTIFAFSPFRLIHQFGHLPLMGTQWLALHYFGLYQLLVSSKNQKKGILFAGIGLGLAGLSSMYFLYMAIVISIFFGLGYILWADRSVLRRVEVWRNLFFAFLVALPFFGAAAYPYFKLSSEGAANHQPLLYFTGWQADALDFVTPSRANFLWGNILPQVPIDPGIYENYIYLGIIPVMLVLLLLSKKSATSDPLPPYKFLLAPALVAMILALGNSIYIPSLRHSDAILKIIPDWMILSGGHLPLPNFFLAKILPFYDGMRAWARYSVFVYLFLAVLAALSFHRISLQEPNWKAKLAVFLLTIGLICADYHIALPLSSTEPRPVDQWLYVQPDRGSVVEFPIQNSILPPYVYASTIHQKPLFGTFYGAHVPDNLQSLLPELERFPTQAGVEILRAREVGYVVFDSSGYPQWESVQASLADYPLTYAGQLDEYVVYLLNPE